MKASQFLTDMYQKFSCPPPTLHCVLGSGLSDALEKMKFDSSWKEIGEISFHEIPNFRAATVSGHPGKYKLFQYNKGAVVSLQLGRLHGYEGLSAEEVSRAVTQIFDAGTKKFLLTNAAGSLKKSYHPSSIMLITDHVNMTGKNPLVGANPVGKNGKAAGPRFPDLSQLYDKKARNRLKQHLVDRFDVHEGVYCGVLGPSFETPAEVKLFSSWGLGAVGMSTVWEAIALKHRGATVSGLSFISNYGCGLVSDEALDHLQVLEQSKSAAKTLLECLFSYFPEELS